MVRFLVVGAELAGGEAGLGHGEIARVHGLCAVAEAVVSIPSRPRVVRHAASASRVLTLAMAETLADGKIETCTLGQVHVVSRQQGIGCVVPFVARRAPRYLELYVGNAASLSGGPMQ